MQAIQMYKSDSGKVFESEIEATLEDLRDALMNSGGASFKEGKRVSTEDLIQAMKWVYQEKDSLTNYLDLIYQEL